jgi:hypothetical protein
MEVAIWGPAVGVVAIVVTIVIFRLNNAKPRVRCDPASNGVLYRCLTKPAFELGWGIFRITGKLRVSNKPVTIVDAELSYLMEERFIRKSPKKMDANFPPLMTFPRVANDDQSSTVSFLREHFDVIKLTPSGGEQQFNISFTLGGNFAEEYSRDFFDQKLSTISDMFIQMQIRFQYEHNGEFYWTDKFDIFVHPFGDRGWTREGSVYINEQGEVIHVRHGAPVHH